MQVGFIGRELLLLCLKVEPDTCLEALQTADRMGLTISCDLNFRKNLWQYGRTAADVMYPLVQYSDVIFGAEPEYKEILGISPVGFKAINTDYQLDLQGFEKVGRQVETLVPRCKRCSLNYGILCRPIIICWLPCFIRIIH